jgi:hypothetical protein
MELTNPFGEFVLIALLPWREFPWFELWSSNLHAFDNGKGPFPCSLCLWAFIESMENLVEHTRTTPPTHFGYVRVGERSPIINCHYFVPCHPNESRFLFCSLLVPYFLPPQLYFVGETIFPFSLHFFSKDSHGFNHLQPFLEL